MKYIPKFIIFIAIFLAGFYFAIFWGGFRYGAPRKEAPYIPLSKPIDVDPKYILPKDSWVLNYQVFIVPLDDVDSKRAYALVILRPLGNIDVNILPNVKSRFLITGLADKEELLMLSLNPNKIFSNPNVEYVHLVDFGGDLLSKNKIQLSEGLRMVSSSSDNYNELKKQSQ